jgi:hypothetical protein
MHAPPTRFLGCTPIHTCMLLPLTVLIICTGQCSQLFNYSCLCALTWCCCGRARAAKESQEMTHIQQQGSAQSAADVNTSGACNVRLRWA